MALKIKVLTGGGFVEKEVDSTNIGALRGELNIPAGSSVSVGGSNVTDSHELSGGDLVAAVENDKGGGKVVTA